MAGLPGGAARRFPTEVWDSVLLFASIPVLRAASRVSDLEASAARSLYHDYANDRVHHTLRPFLVAILHDRPALASKVRHLKLDEAFQMYNTLTNAEISEYLGRVLNITNLNLANLAPGPNAAPALTMLVQDLQAGRYAADVALLLLAAKKVKTLKIIHRPFPATGHNMLSLLDWFKLFLRDAQHPGWGSAHTFDTLRRFKLRCRQRGGHGALPWFHADDIFLRRVLELPNLDMLNIDGLRPPLSAFLNIGGAVTHPPNMGVNISNVRHITLKRSSFDATWLAALIRSCNALKTLRVGWPAGPFQDLFFDLADLEQALKAHAGTLKYLVLQIGERGYNGNLISCPRPMHDLTTLTELEFLEIDESFVFHPQTYGAHSRWEDFNLQSTMQRFLPPNLTTLFLNKRRYRCPGGGWYHRGMRWFEFGNGTAPARVTEDIARYHDRKAAQSLAAYAVAYPLAVAGRLDPEDDSEDEDDWGPTAPPDVQPHKNLTR